MILPTIKHENNRKIKFFQKGEIQGQFNKKKKRPDSFKDI